MTKLLEWLSLAGVFASIWLSLLTNKVEFQFVKENRSSVLFAPVLLVGLFGIYATSVVLYRVFTFNNCEKAAAELQQEIVEANADLARLGFKTNTNTP